MQYVALSDVDEKFQNISILSNRLEFKVKICKKKEFEIQRQYKHNRSLFVSK